MNAFQTLTALLICGQLFQGCKRSPLGHSESKITNGVQISSKRFTAVISQDGCTGTFVSPTTIVTAAHCADKGFTYNGVRTKSWQSLPEMLNIPWTFALDVRVLIFPQAVAPAWIPISKRKLEKDEFVVLAGYGTYDVKNGKGDGKFRWGTSRVRGFEADDHLIQTQGTSLERITGTEGTNSSLGPGDSGGPMLRDGQLVGIASAIVNIGNDGLKVIHVNLNHPEIASFLQEQIKRNGAQINFDGEGTIPYKECFDVDSKKAENNFSFEVPHRRLVSVVGKWSTCTCDDCQETDAKGYTSGALAAYRPKYKNVAAGALLIYGKRRTDPNDKAVEKEGFWAGQSLNFKEMAFGARLLIHDSKLDDNKGSVKACFE